MEKELGFIEYNTSNKNYARENRKNPTKAENIVWQVLLRNKQMLGYKFSRQKPLGPFIVDFYCAKLKLAIEIDGSSHDGREEYDARRTIELNELGITVVRYSNDDVFSDFDLLSIDLESQIKKRIAELD